MAAGRNGGCARSRALELGPGPTGEVAAVGRAERDLARVAERRIERRQTAAPGQSGANCGIGPFESGSRLLDRDVEAKFLQLLRIG